MGADGGSIPRRDELVKQKKKSEKKDKDVDLASKWRYCAFSSERLRKPIVACPLGRLFNKESIIEFLINKDEHKSNPIVNHIRNLKDIKELNLTEKKIEKKIEKTNDDQLAESNYICPVVGLEMNGNYRFLFAWNCGCVVSERAVKEVKSDVCLKCNQPLTAEDLIPINGTDEEIENLRIKLEETRRKQKESKKNKKRKVDEVDKNDKVKKNGSSNLDSKAKQIKNSIVKPSTALLLPEKAKETYSISNDPNASETYKSLFTTHESAKNQTKNNWVTFNPGYYR